MGAEVGCGPGWWVWREGRDSVGGMTVEVFLGKLGTHVCTESYCCDAVVTPGLWAVWAVLTWGYT